VQSFQRSYDADTGKMKQIGTDLRDAYVTLNAEHIRNADVNLLRRASVLDNVVALGVPFAGGLLTNT
jgi:hypothetical protein